KTGSVLCSNCGAVISTSLIDEKSEWRSFEENSLNPSRVGAANNPLLENDQLDTIISNIGNLTSYSLNRTQLKSTMRGPERSLISGFNCITHFCERSSISKTISDRAKMIFKTIDEKKLLKGKNSEGVIAACIYISCKQEQSPRTFKEISLLTNVPKKEIGRSYKLISQFIKNVVYITTDDIVARFCSDLSLSIEHQKIAVEISKKITTNGLMTGKSPDSVAAAVIYLLTNIFNLKHIQRDIPMVTNVTDVTIKNTYKDLLAYQEEILPPDVLSKARHLR
ncbi:Transcription initiation factor TFIIB, partial [Pseudoloma neurophilia]